VFFLSFDNPKRFLRRNSRTRMHVYRKIFFLPEGTDAIILRARIFAPRQVRLITLDSQKRKKKLNKTASTQSVLLLVCAFVCVNTLENSIYLRNSFWARGGNSIKPFKSVKERRKLRYISFGFSSNSFFFLHS